jgi:hypothetical protein
MTKLTAGRHSEAVLTHPCLLVKTPTKAEIEKNIE